MATDFVSLILKDREEKEKNKPAQNSFQDTIFNRSPDEMYYWRDISGNTNRSNLTTGETTRFRDIKGRDPNRTAARDSALADLGQSIGGALQRQGANYKSALATLGLGAAGLLHGDNNYQPEVGSALWRLTEGAEADTGVANKLMEDSKYGRGTLGRFTMDLASGAVDLAGDQLLNLVAPGSGMAAMAARSFGGTAEEQREQGKSISTQFFKGLKSAAIEYGTEKFAGIGGRSIEGGGYIDNLLSRAEESIVRKGGNAFLTKLGFAFGSEAVEEMMSDWLNPLADKFLAGVVKGDYDIEDFPSFAEVAYDGLVGGALGLLGGAREGLQAQSRVRSMGGNQGYADFLAQERADTKAQVKDAKKAKKAQLKAIFDYATHHAEQAMDRAKNIKANEAPQTPVEAQQVPTQQVTPKAAETPENAPSREFNSKPEAETDVPFTFGEETAPETAAPAPEVAPAAEEITPDMLKQDDDAERYEDLVRFEQQLKQEAENRKITDVDKSPTPDDDAEPREALEEVSRWKTEKPVEDTADAEKEGKEFSPEETKSSDEWDEVFAETAAESAKIKAAKEAEFRYYDKLGDLHERSQYSDLDERMLREEFFGKLKELGVLNAYLKGGIKEVERTVRGYPEAKPKKPKRKAAKKKSVGADLLVEQSKTSEQTKAEAKAESVKSGADLLAEQAGTKSGKETESETDDTAKKEEPKAEKETAQSNSENANSEVRSPEVAKQMVRDAAARVLRKELGDNYGDMLNGREISSEERSNSLPKVENPENPKIRRNEEGATKQAASISTREAAPAKDRSKQQIAQTDSRKPKDVQIKLSDGKLTHDTVWGDAPTAKVTNTAFKEKLEKLFGGKDVVITGQTQNVFDGKGNVTGREFFVNAISVDGKQLLGKPYYDALSKLGLKAKPRIGVYQPKYRSPAGDDFEERRAYIGNRNVDINERLRYAEEMDKADYAEAVENYAERYIKEETENGAFVGTPETFEKGLERFIDNYKENHDYSWVVSDEEVVKRDNKRNTVYALEDSDFMMQFDDEAGKSEDARKARISRAPTYVMNRADIARDIKKAIEENVKPITNEDGELQNIDSGTFALELEGGESPYNMTATYVHELYRDSGRGHYIIEVYHTKAKAKNGTDVRLFRGEYRSLDGAANESARNIWQYERDANGGSANEARFYMTRREMVDELEKQVPEKGAYIGTYSVGPFECAVTPVTENYHGQKVIDRLRLTIYDVVNGKVYDNDKFKLRDGKQPDMVQRMATAVHDLNYTTGEPHVFDIIQPREQSVTYEYTANGLTPDEEARKVSPTQQEKKGKGQNQPKGKWTKDASGFQSQFDPDVIEYKGKLYEVVQGYDDRATNDQKSAVIQHKVYEIDNFGNRVDNKEASINVLTAPNPEDAVKKAVDGNKFVDTTDDEHMKAYREEYAKKGAKYGKQEASSNGNSAQWNNGDGTARGNRPDDSDSGNAGRRSRETERALREAARAGEKVSLDQLYGEDGYDSEQTLTYVPREDYTPGMKANAAEVKRITGKDVRFVRGRWSKTADPDGTSRAVAFTSEKGEIVFNLDYYEYSQSKGSKNSERAILLHESFHSLVKQNPGILVFARRALAKFYGKNSLHRFATTYAEHIYGSKLKTEMALNADNEYPARVYEELCADAFGATARWGVNMSKASNSIRFDTNLGLQSLHAKPELAEQLNSAAAKKAADSTKFEASIENLLTRKKGISAFEDAAEDADERQKPPKYSDVEETLNQASKENEETLKRESLDDLAKRIKSSDNKFYGERKANITKAAEAISKNIGKDASTVLPEDLLDFVGKDFSQASKDIDGFAKEFLTALATEDDGVALKTLADDLPKRIKKSKALKELLGDAETGNVAKMARVLAEAEDAKTAQNAASDLAEMIAKEAEEMPKRLKTLEQWDKNLSKRSPVARFLSGDKTLSQIASVYFGYQRDMINVLQGLDNFDKYGDGYGYKLAKKILDANFKSQTALGNSIDHVLTAQAEFEKSGGANKTVELKMLKKNQWESHKISLAEAVDFLHTIRTLQASKVNAWQDITYLVGDEKLTISSQENFNRIMDVLTKTVRSDKAANAYYQSFTDGYAMFKDSSKEAIRDASGRTVDMFEDGTYYPISSAPNGKASAEHDYDFGLDSTRYMQRRVSESGGVIQIFDPAVRFNSYAHTAANLVARAATGAEVERLNRGGLGKSITGIVEERYGKGATDTVKQYIKDSSNFRQESDTASSLLRNLRLNIQGGALFGNFGSMLKQYPSVYNAAGVLDFDSITHGIISQMNAGNRSRAAALGSIKTRHQGNLDPSVAETLNENSGFKKAMEKLKILKFAKEGFEIVDSAAIRTIYLASEYQVEVKDNISRDSAEFNDRVMDYFIPAFLQTQPQFEKTLRPFVQTSDSELIRMFGMFKTQPLRNLNTMIRTISEYSTVKEKYGTDSKYFKETEKQLRHTVAGQASASLMFGALGVLAKLLYHRRKDLEDKDGKLDPSKVMSRVLMNAAEASGGMLVFGDAAVQMVIDMASGGKTNEFYGLSAGAVSSVADALDAITTFAEKPTAYNAKRTAGYISTLFGIPLNNAYAILNSAIMYGKDISGSNEDNYDDILKYLDAQAKAAKKEEEKAAKAAAKEAEKSGADMLADTAKQNASQSELNSQEEKKATEVSTYLKKPYQALLDSGMSSEKSQDLLAFIDTDGNNSIKQAEMFAFYKDNPNYEQYVMAMWNAYGYKTSWESYKAKHK